MVKAALRLNQQNHARLQAQLMLTSSQPAIRKNVVLQPVIVCSRGMTRGSLRAKLPWIWDTIYFATTIKCRGRRMTCWRSCKRLTRRNLKRRVSSQFPAKKALAVKTSAQKD